METYKLPQFNLQVHIQLFLNVANSAALKKRIVNASSAGGDEGDREREAVNFAFIDARLITSLLHLNTAIYQAILAENQGALRTKTVHSEILWALNPTNNITEALRRYGISETTSNLFVVRIGSPDLTFVLEKMESIVEGNPVDVSELKGITDWSTVKKHYKLNADQAIKDSVGNTPREHSVIDQIVISSVAMKSVMA